MLKRRNLAVLGTFLALALVVSGCIVVGDPLPIQVTGTVDVEIPGYDGPVFVASNVETVDVAADGSFSLTARPEKDGKVTLKAGVTGAFRSVTLVSRQNIAGLKMTITESDKVTGAFNTAFGRSYTWEGSIKPASGYPDTDPPSKLTDGNRIPSTSTEYSDSRMVGLGAGAVGAVPAVDLGYPFPIEHIRVSVLTAPSAGIVKPTDVEFFIHNGTDWESVGAVQLTQEQRDTPGTEWIGIDVAGSPTAQRVKVKLTRTDSGAWIFVDELEVMGRWVD